MARELGGATSATAVYTYHAATELIELQLLRDAAHLIH